MSAYEMARRPMNEALHSVKRPLAERYNEPWIETSPPDLPTFRQEVASGQNRMVR